MPLSSKLQYLHAFTTEGEDTALEAAKDPHLHLVGGSGTEQLPTAPTPTSFQVPLHSSAAVWPSHRLVSSPANFDNISYLALKPRTPINLSSRGFWALGTHHAGVCTSGKGVGCAWRFG